MIPLELKIAYTLIALALLVIYWRRYGPGNFLWFCDLALIVLIPALWLESALLVSMMAVSILLPELVWNAVFWLRVFTGIRIRGVIDYMFDPERPTWLKALSLFHVPLPILLLWLLWRLGYDADALYLTTLMAWVVVPATWLLTPAERNINWIHGPGGEGRRQRYFPPLLYLGLVMLALPVLFYLPAHWMLGMMF
jgi:hypothetical protein